MAKAFLPCTLALLLAACATPAPEPLPVTLPGSEPITGRPYDLTPGPSDLDPDVCNGTAYSRLVGQSGSAVATAGITAPVRVIPLGSLVTEDYSSARINFYLDGAGIIDKISCG